MKKGILYKSCLCAALAFAAVACNDDDVTIGAVDTGVLDVPEGSVLYVTDNTGSAKYATVSFRNTAKHDIVVNATSAANVERSAKFVYDESLVEKYNDANRTSFVAFPQARMSLSAENAVLPAGEVKSTPVELTLTSDGSLDPTVTYVVPLRVEAGSNSTLAEAAQQILIFIKDNTALPDATKYVDDGNGNMVEGIKIFSVMEVNDTNPLNVLRYTLKSSGKYMVDCLVMFSGNINYNAETGKVYFFANTQITNILANTEKYLKPLKDRGIKVCMGVMCNHDRACISNLAPETAKAFADELTALCDAYDLDGIFWDDEYCRPISPAPAGFVSPSNKAWSNLAYEFWKRNPTRWNIAYGYSSTGSGTDIDGVQSGTFVSYVLPDYAYGMSDWRFNGMPKSHMGAYSMECARGTVRSESQLRSMRDAGYGAMMMFAMDPFRTTANRQDQAFANMARAFYDDEVVIDYSCKYEPDHK